jgi:hypothetical protein
MASDNRVSPPKSALNQEQSRARLRRPRLVEHLHRLGPAPLGHFLHEIECGAFIPEHLEAYARIDPDRFAPSLYVIDGHGP